MEVRPLILGSGFSKWLFNEFTGVAQVVSEGMDDTTIDLSQLETGRSVPSTPLQVSPQGSYFSFVIFQCSLKNFLVFSNECQEFDFKFKMFKLIEVQWSRKIHPET